MCCLSFFQISALISSKSTDFCMVCAISTIFSFHSSLFHQQLHYGIDICYPCSLDPYLQMEEEYFVVSLLSDNGDKIGINIPTQSTTVRHLLSTLTSPYSASCFNPYNISSYMNSLSWQLNLTLSKRFSMDCGSYSRTVLSELP